MTSGGFFAWEECRHLFSFLSWPPSWGVDPSSSSSSSSSGMSTMSCSALPPPLPLSLSCSREVPSCFSVSLGTVSSTFSSLTVTFQRSPLGAGWTLRIWQSLSSSSSSFASFLTITGICAHFLKTVDLTWDGKLNTTGCNLGMNSFVFENNTFYDRCIS